jgi:hypothetical protein
MSIFQWLGEQEFKLATELPHHDRKWAQRLAEKKETPLA